MCPLSTLDPDNTSTPEFLRVFVQIISFPGICLDNCIFSLLNLLPHKGKPDFNRETWKQISRTKLPIFYYGNEWYNYILGSLIYGQFLQWISKWLDVYLQS